MRTWQRDIELDVESCQAIVARQFPQFSGSMPNLFGSGWDNICVLYEGQTVFRLPTREMGGRIIRHEIAALPLLCPLLPVAVPDFQFVGQPDDAYPYHFVGYPLLPGRTSDHLTWNHPQRVNAAVVLGEFLRSLHSVPITEALSRALPTKRHDQVDIDWMLDRIQVRHKAVVEAHPERAAWADGLLNIGNQLGQGLVGDDVLAVVHGDLYPRHILADETCRVTGVIDWGDIRIATPANDLSLAYTFFEAEERDAFWQAYGLPVSDEWHRFARMKAVLYALALYSYGMDIGDQPIAELGEVIGTRVFN